MVTVTNRISDQERRIIAEQEQAKQAKQQVTQEIRELRWQNRQLRKMCGKQGQTIYLLRAELAEVRELNSKLERGELRRQERVIEEQAETIIRLKRKLSALTLSRVLADHAATATQPLEVSPPYRKTT